MQTFTKTVSIPKRDSAGAVITDNGKPVVERELGVFTFRAPTFREQKDIAVRVDRDFCQFPSLDRIKLETFYRIMACAHFPYQVETAPDGFDWDAMTLDEGRALYDAYTEGLEGVTGTKNSAQ